MLNSVESISIAVHVLLLFVLLLFVIFYFSGDLQRVYSSRLDGVVRRKVAIDSAVRETK